VGGFRETRLGIQPVMRSKRPGPSPIAGWILRLLSRAEDRLSLEGDFDEEFDWRIRSEGAARARLWYWGHLVKSAPSLITNAAYWRMTMFKSYLKIAWRNTLKHKGYALIKTAGLAMGIGCCLLAYLHIKTELSYDGFHRNGDSTFRVIRVLYEQEGYRVRHRDPSLAPQMGSLLPQFFPEVQDQTRYADFLPGVVISEDRLFQEAIPMADASFFRIFSFPLLKGNPASVLSTVNDIVLTESYARKYFGQADPMGRRLTISYGDVKKDFFVSGIAADPPKNSVFQFTMIISIGNLPAFLNKPDFLTGWNPGVWPIPVYVQLRPGVNAADLEKRFPIFTAQYFSREIASARADGWARPEVPFSFGLQKIQDVYLDSSVYLGKGLTESLVLSGVVLLILIMACMNFTNLSLGTASFRAKEIGIRKVIGAERRQLVHQFWGEALITVGGAALAGIGLAVLLLPAFSQLVGKSYAWNDFLSLSNVLVVAALVLITGGVAASYPSLVMASFRPVEIIRGKFRFGRKKTLTRALVIFQFMLSAVLITSALVFQKQMRVLNARDLGYHREGLLAVRTQDGGTESSRNLLALYRERVLRNPRVLAITACNAAFGLHPAPRQDTDEIDCHWNGVDADFVRTIGARVVQGDDFRSDHSANSGTALVNESFVRAFRVDAPVGMTIGQAIALHEPGYDIPDVLKGLVIRGVTNDFQFAPLSFGVFPAIFHVQPTSEYSRMLIRVSTDSLPDTLKFLERRWRDIRPDKPFAYYFQDEALGRLLQAESRWTRMVAFCSVLAILLACMGIFGLTSISMNSRVREIGIRKTFGAPFSRIVGEAYRDLLGPVAAAVGLAWPVAFFLLQNALRRFPYRINIPAADFLLGGILTLMIAVGTTLVLVLKAAAAAPAASLRRE
jgi:putative ABC transport system permease protein